MEILKSQVNILWEIALREPLAHAAFVYHKPYRAAYDNDGCIVRLFRDMGEFTVNKSSAQVWIEWYPYFQYCWLTCHPFFPDIILTQDKNCTKVMHMFHNKMSVKYVRHTSGTFKYVNDKSCRCKGFTKNEYNAWQIVCEHIQKYGEPPLHAYSLWRKNYVL